MSYYTKAELDALYTEVSAFSSDAPVSKDRRVFYKDDSELIFTVTDKNIAVERNGVFEKYITVGYKKNWDSFLTLVHTPHSIGVKRRLTKVEFELKAGPVIFAKLEAVKDSNAVVKYWYRLFDNPDFEYVELDGANFATVTAQLVLDGVLTQAEVDQLLA